MKPVLQIVANAVSNATSHVVSSRDIRNILATGDGPGNIVRALFSDCSAETLQRQAAAWEVPMPQLNAAYLKAKTEHKAANADFEKLSLTN